ncbi:MAG: hypothetical protein D6679_05435 [Candidatus Hydrogenedentota bacterium]|nr:MAG: hypothetical protein D6679_05435 [Candidatus Hydrogenedentota bacterium]
MKNRGRHKREENHGAHGTRGKGKRQKSKGKGEKEMWSADTLVCRGACAEPRIARKARRNEEPRKTTGSEEAGKCYDI